MTRLHGRVAILTGAAGGIGSALARALDEAGCRLVLVDLAEDRLQPMAADFPEALLHPMDVRSPEAWAALATRVQTELGGAHILVNNAGLTFHGRFVDHSLEDVQRVLEVNLMGTIYGCYAFLPQLRAAEEAQIVNLSSFAGFHAFPFQSTYSASKFGVRGFSAALRMELAGEGVGVTTVMPGAVATRFLARAGTRDPKGVEKLSRGMLSGGVAPHRLARKIVRAIRRNRAELVVGPEAVLTGWVQWLAPWLTRWALTRMVAGLTVDGRWKGSE